MLFRSGIVRFNTPPPKNCPVIVYANQSSEILTGTVKFYTPTVYSVSATGLTRDYWLPYYVYSGTEPNNYLVTVGGLVKIPSTDYTLLSGVNGGTLRFSYTPASALSITVHSYKFSTTTVFNSIMNYLTASNYNVPVSSISTPAISVDNLFVTSSLNVSSTMVTTYSSPVTASGDFLSINVGNKLRLIRLWDF